MVLWALFLLYLLLQAFGQQGHDFVAVAYDAEVGNTENGGEFVLVDGDDEVGFLHTCKVLDGITPSFPPSYQSVCYKPTDRSPVD